MTQQRVAELRAEYRAVARASNEEETFPGIFALAAELEQEACDLPARN